MADPSFDRGRRRWLAALSCGAAGLFLRSRAASAAPAAANPAPEAKQTAPAGPAAPATPPLRLSLNENPFGPSPRAVQAVRDGLSDLSRYTDVDAEALVSAIAAREGVAPRQVVLGDVLEALGRELVRQGSGGELLYSNPGYTALVDAARLVGGSAVPVPLDARQENDLAALRSHIGPRTRAVFLVNPHNPSGTVSDVSALRAYVEEAARRTTVIVDEAYLEYLPDHAERTLVRQARPDGRVVVFRTFTKFYGLAAVPLSYAILPDALASALRAQGLGAPRAQNRLAVLAARASLADGAYAERVRRRVAAERVRWFDVLDGLGLQRTQAVGSFVFFRAGRPQSELAAAFAQRGIDIGRAFPPLDDWARISIGLPEENTRAQQALRQIIAG